MSTFKVVVYGGGLPGVFAAAKASAELGGGEGNVVFSNGTTETLNATVFIEASNEGRLARRVNTACTTGRFDWPAQYLSSGEIGGSDFVARQQACSLVLKIKNIHPTHCNYYEGTNVPSCLWSPYGPNEDPNGLITAFNNAHKDEGVLLRPANGAREGRWSICMGSTFVPKNVPRC